MRRSIWLGIIVALVALSLGVGTAAGVSVLVMRREMRNTTQFNRRGGHPNGQPMPYAPGMRRRRVPPLDLG